MTSPRRRPNALQTDRLLLREADKSTLEILARGELPPGQPGAAGYPLEGTRVAASMALLDPGELSGFGMYQIIEVTTGDAIGDIGFHGPPAEGVAEVGYGIVPARRRHGFATEALRELARWALTDPRVQAIEASTDHDNEASQKVLLAAGFRPLAEQGTGPWLRYRLATD